MDVYEAVTSRRAVRGFTDQPVSREVLERVLSAAAWSPSGSNLQPWNTYVVTGAPLAELKKLAVERVAAGDPWDDREYEMYPPGLKSPYRERRSAFGRERYASLGIAREDWEARQRAAIANWDCFGAPAALFCYIDRDLGPAQWADTGMYLQTVMRLRYTAFCNRYRSWLARRGLVMRQVHVAGEKMFVDYAGKKPSLVDPATGEATEVELFVAVLGASSYTDAEATRCQRGPDWIGSHCRAFAFFGGVSRAVGCAGERCACGHPYDAAQPLHQEYQRQVAAGCKPNEVRDPCSRISD